MDSYAQIRSWLSGAYKAGRFPHAVLICGGEPVLQEQAALGAAAELTGVTDPDRLFDSPDFIMLEAHSARVSDIREKIGLELSRRPFSGGRRAVYIHNAHRLTEACQNTLLKTLEEPPADTCFLLTGNEAGLLPTIRSRCAILRPGLISASQVAQRLAAEGIPPAKAAVCAAAGGGRLETAIELCSSEEAAQLRENALLIMDKLLSAKLPLPSIPLIAGTRENADRAVDYMLSYCRDVMIAGVSNCSLENPDREAKIRIYASRFTDRRIHCIIDLLIDAKKRIGTSAGQSMLLDRLLIQIKECVDQGED